MGRLPNANLLESSVKTKFGVSKVKSLPGTVISFSFCCGNIHCHALKLMDDSFSAVAESQFSAFFVRRPRPKRRICLFLIFRRGGKPIFAVFLISSTDDE